MAYRTLDVQRYFVALDINHDSTIGNISMYETQDKDYVTLGIDSEYVNDRLMIHIFEKIQKTSTDLDLFLQINGH